MEIRFRSIGMKLNGRALWQFFIGLIAALVSAGPALPKGDRGIRDIAPPPS